MCIAETEELWLLRSRKLTDARECILLHGFKPEFVLRRGFRDVEYE